jgi:hypothetical protein
LFRDGGPIHNPHMADLMFVALGMVGGAMIVAIAFLLAR